MFRIVASRCCTSSPVSLQTNFSVLHVLMGSLRNRTADVVGRQIFLLWPTWRNIPTARGLHVVTD